MRISDWSSDVCSSDLVEIAEGEPRALLRQLRERELDIAFVTGQHDFVDLDSEVMWSESVVLAVARDHHVATRERLRWSDLRGERFIVSVQEPGPEIYDWLTARLGGLGETTDIRSEEHTSELQSLMRISYAVVCLITKNKQANRYA